MSSECILRLTVNGTPQRRLITSHRSLLDFLREDLDFTGTKHGCDLGDCGACTVLVDGQPRLSCITLAADMQGASIVTIEGIGDGFPDGIHPIQHCFDRHVASQCGYCTPGIVLALAALLRESPQAEESEIREVLGSNLCRCTGYTKILAAAREAAGRA